jgi:putative thioredoxin
MNIDEYPQIAGQLGIQSIPAVYAFQKGQPVDGFMGALPESQVKAFIERLIGPLGSGNEDLLKEAAAALASGDPNAAAGLFSEALADEPDNPTAIGGLASALVALGNLDDAREVLKKAPTGTEGDPAVASARAALENAEQAESVGDLTDLEQQVVADPKNHQARFDLALALNALGKMEVAADALLEIIRRDRTWNDDGARKQLLQFFDAWGPMDPDTMTARRKLSGALFS